MIDVGIALVRDDALGIILQLLLAVGDMPIDMILQAGRELQLFYDLFILLKQFNRIPLKGTAVDLLLNGFLDMRQGMFHDSAADVRPFPDLPALRVFDGAFRDRGGTVAFEGAHRHDLAAQRVRQPLQVDPVPALLHEVHHVEGDDHRDVQLQKLRRQVQVPLDVRSVHDIDDGIRLIVDKIVPGYDFLQGIRGQGIDSRKVLDDDILMPLQPSVFFLHRDSRPVPDILGASGQVVEQRRLPAVRVARKGDLDLHFSFPF